MFKFLKYWRAFHKSVKEDTAEFCKYCSLINVDEDIVKNYNAHLRKLNSAIRICRIGMSSVSYEEFCENTYSVFYPAENKYDINYWLSKSASEFDSRYAGALAVRVYLDYIDTSLSYVYQFLSDLTSKSYPDPNYMDKVVTPIVDSFHKLLEATKSTSH